jgi:ferredoxin
LSNDDKVEKQQENSLITTNIEISSKALERLKRAQKEGESLSEVILRLTSTTLEGLQRRGVKRILTLDDQLLEVEVDQSKCMGAESCVALAPKVFALDVSQLGRAPLGMRDVEDREVDGEDVINAARTCPYEAIIVRDAKKDNEQMVP